MNSEEVLPLRWFYVTMHLIVGDDMKKFLLLFICLMVLFCFSGCGAKEQISYDFDTYLSYNNSFEKNFKLVMPSKDELNGSTILDYVYYDSGATAFEPDRMIQMTVQYSQDQFVIAKEKLEQIITQYDSSCEIENFYINSLLYEGFNFYNYDARDDEFKDTYNDGYCAFAYHISKESNTISYIAFESGNLQYMNMESALSLFPEFQAKK